MGQCEVRRSATGAARSSGQLRMGLGGLGWFRVSRDARGIVRLMAARYKAAEQGVSMNRLVSARLAG